MFFYSNYQQVHDHGMRGITSFDDGHQHYYSGETAFGPSGIQHIHNYSIYTTFDDGHTHLIRGNTGPAIYLPNGEHYHLFEGMTTINGSLPHKHLYNGQTSF